MLERLNDTVYFTVYLSPMMEDVPEELETFKVKISNGVVDFRKAQTKRYNTRARSIRAIQPMHT
jgi:hypothetical protein